MRKLCCHKRALWFSGARGSMSADGARTLSCSRTTPIAGTLSAASSAKFNSLCSAAIVRNLENEQLEPDTERVKSAECEGERILRGAQSSRRFCAHFPPILTFPNPTLPRAPSYTHNPVPAINTFYLSDTFIEYLCNLIDYCTTKWRRQYYCTIYNKMRQRCLLAWIV